MESGEYEPVAWIFDQENEEQTKSALSDFQESRDKICPWIPLVKAVQGVSGGVAVSERSLKDLLTAFEDWTVGSDWGGNYSRFRGVGCHC